MRLRRALTAPPRRGDESPPAGPSSTDDSEAIAATAAAAAAAAVALGSAEPEEAAVEAPLESGGDPRADVMTDYFDVMRSFLEQQRSVVESWQTRSSEEPHSSAAASLDLPFLSELVEHDEQRLVARCHLDLADNFLRSHVLSGRVSESEELSGLACVPLMVSVEVMAEACSLLAGGAAVQVIENVRAFDWIALDDEALVLEVHAEVVDAERALHRATIFNGGEPVVTADFRFESSWRLEASFRSGRRGPRLERCRALHHGHVPRTGVPERAQHRRLERRRHRRRSLRSRSAGLLSVVRPRRLVLNPVLLDAVGQVAAYWVAQQAGVDFNCFPSTIDRIELYAPCPADLPGLTMQGRQRPLEAGATEVSAPRTWDFECLDAAGAPLLRIGGLVNVFFPVPHTFYEARRDPLRGLLGQQSPVRPTAGVSLWEVPHYAEDFCSQSNGIFLRILAHTLLGSEERAEWRALTGPVRRKREWLFGRAAIKEAVRMTLFQQTGKLLYPSDIAVLHDELGAPFVDGWWRDELANAPQVSLSHTDRACLVAVAAADSPVGVDFEDVGRIRRPQLLVDALTAGERSTVAGLDGVALDDRLLRLWCAKEATAKYLGIGLQGQPQAFEVGFVDSDCARAQVVFEGGTTEVRLVRDGPAVIAVAAGEPTATEVHDAPDSRRIRQRRRSASPRSTSFSNCQRKRHERTHPLHRHGRRHVQGPQRPHLRAQRRRRAGHAVPRQDLR